MNILVSFADSWLVFVGFFGDSRLCSDRDDFSGDLLIKPSLLGFLMTAVFASRVDEILCLNGVFSLFSGAGVACAPAKFDRLGEGFGILDDGAGVWCLVGLIASGISVPAFSVAKSIMAVAGGASIMI